MGYRLKVIVFALCSLFLVPLQAQEINCAVTVNSDMIEGSNTLQEVTTKPLTQTTAFTCTLTDAYGNSFTTPQTAIMVKQYPVTNLSVVNPILINNVSTTILGSTVTLLANAYQGADYTWEPASMIYNIIEPWKVVVKPEQIGETTFHVTIDDSGCVSEEDIIIKEKTT